MQQEMKDRILYELVVTAVGTIAFLGIWYLAEMPEWKRQELWSRIKGMKKATKPDRFIQEMQKFRAQITTWEHDQCQ